MAACPTPLPAPRTSTSSPGDSFARVTSMCHAVRNVSGNAAASTKADGVRNGHDVLDRGAHELGIATVTLRSEHVVLGAQVVAPIEARVAAPAREPRLQHHAAARRQILVGRGDDLARNVRTEMCGSGSRTTPRRFQRSRWFSAQARTRITTSPARNWGSGAVFVAQDVWSPVLMQSDRFHRFSAFSSQLSADT